MSYSRTHPRTVKELSLEIQVPKYTCPIINEIIKDIDKARELCKEVEGFRSHSEEVKEFIEEIDALRDLGDEAGSSLYSCEEMLEEVRTANEGLREAMLEWRGQYEELFNHYEELDEENVTLKDENANLKERIEELEAMNSFSYNSKALNG